MRAHAFFGHFLWSVSAGLHAVTIVAAVLLYSLPGSGEAAARGGSAERGLVAGAPR